eukprot:gb/GECG01004093.1/.p1 GENE.gb/GECG01004093.1/~~gb/GECG01004093.1/.p1  ORF type:complete len:277 (+),score=16.96 gb/GECG01004093.1/:1-831(+)
MDGNMPSEHSFSIPRGYRRHFLHDQVFVVRNRYVQLEASFCGANGLVAKANDLVTGRKVAIKKITNVFRDGVQVKRILRELKLLRHFREHDNITHIVDIMTEPPVRLEFRSLYIVVEAFDWDLEDLLFTSRQYFPESHVAYFVYQMLRALKYIHSADVLHRDLKPANVLVNSDGHLALGDFGLARGISSDMGHLTDDVVTLWYRAPEILCGLGTYDAKADLWSVGCVLAEFVCHTIYTEQTSKTGMTILDNKRFVLNDGISTLAWGHKDIPQLKHD